MLDRAGQTGPMRHLGPDRLHRVLADAEAVTWALLILGMVLKYVTRTTDLGVTVFGGVHGFVFLAYGVVTVVVGIDQRWRARTVLVGLASAVPPFATIPFERWVRRRGLAERWWRLRQPGSARSVPERALAAVLARPVLAVVAVVVGVSVVFGALLRLGPPTG
jgi:integral membrane protein